jgi:hypothetical protein
VLEERWEAVGCYGAAVAPPVRQLGDEASLIAFVDESGSNTTLDPNTYIMAAALVTDAQLEPLRERMASMLLPGQSKLHWRHERVARQRVIVEAVAALEVEHFVVITTPHKPSSRAERRRRITLETLLPELSALGVGESVFESRGPADDERDRAMLDHLRRQGLMDHRFRLDHLPGRADAALWVPDAICGIVTAMRCGHDEFYQALASRLTVLQRAPR